jgi:hypothetical protein
MDSVTFLLISEIIVFGFIGIGLMVRKYFISQLEIEFEIYNKIYNKTIISPSKPSKRLIDDLVNIECNLFIYNSTMKILFIPYLIVDYFYDINNPHDIVNPTQQLQYEYDKSLLDYMKDNRYASYSSIQMMKNRLDLLSSSISNRINNSTCCCIHDSSRDNNKDIT